MSVGGSNALRSLLQEVSPADPATARAGGRVIVEVVIRDPRCQGLPAGAGTVEEVCPVGTEY